MANFTPRLRSRRTADWAQRIADMCSAGAKAPPGWLTSEQWSERMQYSPSRTARILAMALEQGTAKRALFRVEKGKYEKRNREHWWIKGASDAVVREGAK